MSRIRYMGNKHGLAPDVVRLAAGTIEDAPLMDIFCGLCSVGRAFATSRRPVWGNDIQEYAALAARCHLCAETGPRNSSELAAVLIGEFRRNSRLLKKRFAEELAVEEKVLRSDDRQDYWTAQAAWRHAGNDETIAREVEGLRASPTPPHRLFTLNFAWGYFGLAQAIAIDSIRYAIDIAKTARTLSQTDADWAVLALAEAASVCASSPGHFAQFLRGTTDVGYQRIRRQRCRDIWAQFISATDEQRPFGPRSWRRTNDVMTHDALTLWPQLDDRHRGSAIVYADPPYSKDHYSRYYHVLETLVRYDYPASAGAGRYRPDRFVTPFSLKREVRAAFTTLFERVAERDWYLILSYPTNGLVPEQELDTEVRRHFKNVDLAVRRPIAHSTLGGRHGSARSETHELMWLAR